MAQIELDSDFTFKLIVVEESGLEYEDLPSSFQNLNITIDECCHKCIVKLHKPIKFGLGCSIDMRGDKTSIELETSRFNYNFHIQTTNSKNQRLYIGKNCSTWSNFYIHLTEDNARVKIGNDCMLSKNIEIWASDGHAIVDIEKNNVLNVEKKGIEIGDRVWISSNVILTKNAVIHNDVVIGAGSVVASVFNNSNIVIAGNPAKIIKKNIKWYRGKPSKIQQDIVCAQNRGIVAIIPSRYNSSRFPGKPLADICGKPMIQWVYERLMSVEEIKSVYVATDDMRIFETVEGFGGNVVMTGECICGTDRVYQACKNIDTDIVLNVQGDEPLIKPEMINDLIGAFNDPDVQMATLKKKIMNNDESDNPNVVKVITDQYDDAIYFSRFAIPYDREKKGADKYKHIGIYGYKKSFLEKFIALPQSTLEKTECLEQLRAIENGYKIRVKETIYQSIGVDQPSDVAKVEEQMKREGIC